MSKKIIFKNICDNIKKWNGDYIIIDTNKDDFSILTNQKIKENSLCIFSSKPENFFRWLDSLTILGIKNYIIIPGEFSSEEKKILKNEIKKNSLNILGPNSIFGIINVSNNLNTTFERNLVFIQGGSSFLIQSGGIGAALLDYYKSNRLGLNKIAFIGNRFNIDEIDLINYYYNDKNTNSIGIYTEGFNIRDKNSLEKLKEINKEKPIVILKGGKTKAGKKRALLHTDSLSSDDDVFSGIFKGLGITIIDSIELLALQTHFFSTITNPIMGNKVAVISNVGGPAIELADKLISNGFLLSNFSTSYNRDIIKKYPQISLINPLDIIADAKYERFNWFLHKLNYEEFDTIIVITALKSTLFTTNDFIKLITSLDKHRFNKNLIFYIPGIDDYFNMLKRIKNNPYFIYYNSKAIVDILKNGYKYYKYTVNL